MNLRRILQLLPDKPYIQLMYFYHFHRFANLKNPQTFNEKLQWLKLYDRNPEYTIMVDKIAAKQYVAEKIGEEFIIPTLGVWSSPDEIDFDMLPDQFVLKWNHDSGSIVICKDKNTFDRESAKNKLRHGEKVNGYWYGREWPYIGVRPKLLAEEYMEDDATKELRDYKVFTFGGKAHLFLVASERQKKGEDVKFDFFDINRNHLDLINNHQNAAQIPQLPTKFDLMISLAEKIAIDYPHLRVDFYEVNGKVYFGEITLYHGSGFMHFKPEKWEKIMGEWIVLPEKLEK